MADNEQGRIGGAVSENRMATAVFTTLLWVRLEDYHRIQRKGPELVFMYLLMGNLELC